MDNKHLQPRQLRSLQEIQVPSHLRARISDTLHQEQAKLEQHQIHTRLLHLLAASLSFIISCSILALQLTANNFGNMLQTIILNYGDIPLRSTFLAILENIPFVSLTFTIISATWLCLSLPRQPLLFLRQSAPLAHLFKKSV